MKRIELFRLQNLFTELRGRANTRLVFAILKNTPKIEAEIDLIKAIDAPSAEFSAFETDRLTLCVHFAKKDDAGQPIVIDGTFDIEDKVAFEAAWADLQLRMAPVLDARRQQTEEIERLLNEDVGDLGLYQIELGHLPTDLLVEQLEILMPMIKE